MQAEEGSPPDTDEKHLTPGADKFSINLFNEKHGDKGGTKKLIEIIENELKRMENDTTQKEKFEAALKGCVEALWENGRFDEKDAKDYKSKTLNKILKTLKTENIVKKTVIAIISLISAIAGRDILQKYNITISGGEVIPYPNTDIPIEPVLPIGGDSIMDTSMGGPPVDIYNSDYVYGGDDFVVPADTTIMPYIADRYILIVFLVVVLLILLLMIQPPTRKQTITQYAVIDRLHNLQNHVNEMIGVVTYADSSKINTVDEKLVKIDKLMAIHDLEGPSGALDPEIAKYTDRETDNPSTDPSVKPRLLKLRNRIGMMVTDVMKNGESQKVTAACRLAEESVSTLRIPVSRKAALDAERGRDIPIYLSDFMEMRSNVVDPEYVDGSDKREYSETSHSKSSVADLMLIKKTFQPNATPVRMMTVKSHTRY